MLDSVEHDLLPRRDAWDDIVDPVDPGLVRVMLEWAWTQAELQVAIRDAYRLADDEDIGTVSERFLDLVASWLSGQPYTELAARAGLPMDDLLGVHTRVVGFVLQTLVEQAVAVLERLLLSQGRTMAAAVGQLPGHLRFGVPTPGARVLAARGVRHRRAAVELGSALVGWVLSEDRLVLFPVARQLLVDGRAEWQERLAARG